MCEQTIVRTKENVEKKQALTYEEMEAEREEVNSTILFLPVILADTTSTLGSLFKPPYWLPRLLCFHMQVITKNWTNVNWRPLFPLNIIIACPLLIH